jgi:heavy metal sensor kinase
MTNSYTAPVKRPRLIRSLALRLTLWYSAVLAAAAILCFGLAYFLFSSMSNRRANTYLQEQAVECRTILKQQGLVALSNQISHEARSTGTNDLFVRLLKSNHSAAAVSDLTEWNNDRIATHAVPTLPPGGLALETWDDLPSHPYTRVLYAEIGENLTLQIGLSLTSDRALLSEMARIGGGFIVGAFLVAILVGWLMARRALSGVQHVTDAAVGIASGRLERRVPISGWNDEVDRLAQTFNTMSDRIQALIEGIKQTNDNIAHELRSPITRMRALAEVNLASAAPDSEHQGLAEDTVEECDRLLALINTMLDIAEVEAGVSRPASHPLDIADIVRDACDIFDPVAENAGVTLHTVLDATATVLGDVPKLQRAIANLLDNAIKYTPSGGAVTAQVTVAHDAALVSISDTGPGIAEVDLPHIFQRFYRGEKSRTRKGYGLGLSLALAIVRAHGGTIGVSNNSPHGACFILKLPLVPPPSLDALPAQPPPV